MKNCKEISELLSERMDRRLTWCERWAVRIHVSMCRSCQRFQQQIGFLSKAADRYKPKD